MKTQNIEFVRFLARFSLNFSVGMAFILLLRWIEPKFEELNVKAKNNLVEKLEIQSSKGRL